MGDIHKGTCFCGAIEIEVTGSPEGMGIATVNPAALGRRDR